METAALKQVLSLGGGGREGGRGHEGARKGRVRIPMLALCSRGKRWCYFKHFVRRD